MNFDAASQSHSGPTPRHQKIPKGPVWVLGGLSGLVLQVHGQNRNRFGTNILVTFTHQ